MNKSILITGSTDGIGKLAATKLAQAGHQVYVHGRNTEKLELTIEEIKEVTKNQNINGYLADLSDLSSIKRFVDQVSSDLDTLDVLINNAGVYNTPTTINEDGLDLRFVVNYIGPVIITNHLIPQLEESVSPLVINLSSAAQSPVSIEALLGKASIPVSESYAQSKLALTMWSFYLSKKLNNVSVVAVNPGSLLNTRMVQEAFGRHWSSADKGADILYDLSSANDPKEFDGKYFDNDKGTISEAHPSAYDQKHVVKLIDSTDNLLDKL